MKVRRKYKKTKVKKRFDFREEFRYVLVITIVCLVLGFALAFITGNVPSFLDRVIQKQTDRIIDDKMKDIGKGMMEKAGKENIDDLVKKYKDKARGYK